MCYIVYKDKDLLDSTAYIQIITGKYNGNHWQNNSLFIAESDFEIFEFIIEYYFPEYDHYSISSNSISKDIGVLIIERFRNIAQLLFDKNNNANVMTLFFLPENVQGYFLNELNQYKNEIQIMLLEISLYLEKSYKVSDFVCIMGI